MTTIAWDGKTLAADRQMTCGSIKQEVDKIHKLNATTYVAGAGCIEEIHLVVEWMKKGKRAKKPEIESSNFLILDKKKKVCYYMSSKLVAIRVYDPMAIGSGDHMAIVAMGMGKTAEEAVIEASKYDIYTGVGIDKIEV